jgi:tetratricopeptide (TPR) repeat protein
VIDRHHHLLGVEAQALRERLQRVDRRTVHGRLARLAQPAVADADAESLEQTLERGRPAVHRGRLDHLGGQEAASARRHCGARRYNARPEAAIPQSHNHADDDARGDDPLIPAIRAHERAIALRGDGHYAEAERACRAAIAGYRAIEGPRHVDVANALVELGLVLEARDRLREAARCQRRALEILALDRSRDPDIARLIVRARTALGGIDRTLGNYAAADRGYRTALAEIRRRFGARDRYLAGVFNDLGVLRKAQGRYDDAFAFYRRALPLVPRGDRHALATLAHNLGGIEHARGNYARAEPHARRSVKLRTALVGPNHPAVAADVAALAAIVEARGRLPEAAALYRRALAVFGRVLGPDSLEVGLNLACLAAVEQRRKAPRRARSLYARALLIQERVLGRHHADVAMTVNNLAVLERDEGNLKRAAALFRRALASFIRTLGTRHPHALLAQGNRRAIEHEIAAGAAKPARRLKKRGPTSR